MGRFGHAGDLEGVLGVGAVVRWRRDTHFGEGGLEVGAGGVRRLGVIVLVFVFAIFLEPLFLVFGVRVG